MAEDDRLMRELYAEARLAPQTDHPDERTWEDLALGELPPAARELVLDHVSRCAECTVVYREVKTLVAEASAFDIGAPRPISRRRVPSSRKWILAGLATAAVLLIALQLPMASRKAADDFLRSAIRPASSDFEPHGTVSAPPKALRWPPVAEANRYRVELLNQDGDRLWESPLLEGTTVAWPASVPASPGVYHWRVIALSRLNRRVSSSPLIAFRIAPP